MRYPVLHHKGVCKSEQTSRPAECNSLRGRDGFRCLESQCWRVVSGRSALYEIKKLTGTSWRRHHGGVLMLWTVFMFLMGVCGLGLVFRFGGVVIPLVLVLALVVLLLKLVIRRTSFN
jgi:hypothetical protein